MNEGVDETGWDVEPGDEIEPVVQAVGRLLKVCREAAGMRAAELGEATGYGEDMIRKMESGMRIPRRSSWTGRTRCCGRRDICGRSWRT
ncbi:hypothetical protein ACE1SV_27090 [Streptomyces sp. E-15]